ncbi:MAG: glycosyltransferase [Geminicoccaceae bacterium]
MSTAVPYPLRIAYLIDSLKLGGAETLLLDLLDGALGRGHRVEVGYFTPGPLIAEVESRGVAVTRLSRHGLLDPLALVRAWRLFRRFKPDVVHTHLTKSDLVGQPAAVLARVPVRLSTLHNVDPWRRNMFLSSIFRLLTSGADRLIAVSEEVARHSATFGSCPNRKLLVLKNGVDTARFSAGEVAPIDLGRWGVPTSKSVVAVIGRLTQQKDHATFLNAVSLLVKRGCDAHFLIVGDGPLRQSLEGSAAEAGLLPDHLTFTGIVRDVPALLAAIDIVAFSSSWEGLPMVLLEAMAMGRPVVATRVGGIPEVLNHGQEGLLVPPADPVGLADALTRALDDGELRQNLAAASIAKVRKDYSTQRMHGRIFDLYHQSLSPA